MADHVANLMVNGPRARAMFNERCQRQYSRSAIRCALDAGQRTSSSRCLKNLSRDQDDTGDAPSQNDCDAIGDALVFSPTTAAEVFGDKAAELIDSCTSRMSSALVRCITAATSGSELDDCPSDDALNVRAP